MILNYTESGSGPVVVLLHGYMSSSKYWQAMADDLRQTHRVIAFDLLGFGKSPKPEHSSYDYSAQLASIDATLSTLKISEPFTLIGHSMGALIALRYAREHASQVKKLVLTNMPIFANNKQAKQEIYGTSLLYRIGLTPSVHRVVWPIFHLATRLHLFRSQSVDGVATHQKYMFQNTASSRLRSLQNVIFAGTIQADLAFINVETVLLLGLQDRIEYIQNLTKLRLNEHIISKIVPGGHHLPLIAPEQITALV